jgi:hypothetical protein
MQNDGKIVVAEQLTDLSLLCAILLMVILDPTFKRTGQSEYRPVSGVGYSAAVQMMENRDRRRKLYRCALQAERNFGH